MEVSEPEDIVVLPMVSETVMLADASHAWLSVTATTNDCPAGIVTLASNGSLPKKTAGLDMLFPSSESEM